MKCLKITMCRQLRRKIYRMNGAAKCHKLALVWQLVPLLGVILSRLIVDCEFRQPESREIDRMVVYSESTYYRRSGF